MSDQTSAQLGASMRAAYKAILPLQSELESRVRKIQQQAEAWASEARELGGSDLDWEYRWLTYSDWELVVGNVSERGLLITVDRWAEELLPFAVIDHMDEVIAKERAKLQLKLEEKERQQAAKRERKRERLLAQLAKLDAEEASDS